MKLAHESPTCALSAVVDPRPRRAKWRRKPAPLYRSLDEL
jgi:hypothetical protein